MIFYRRRKGDVIVPAKRIPVDPYAAKYLLFLDTNIWLDFYRLEANEKMLGALIAHARNRIISTAQVQMEFMKNRQNVLLQPLEKFKSGDDVRVPPVVANAAAARRMKASKSALEARRKMLRSRVERILLNPAPNGPTFRALQYLFTKSTALILGRENMQRYGIRRLARKRWMLGYPPRKDTDLSLGDAINWEWVVKCAKEGGGCVIIVSRDKDYGRIYNDHAYLNDWLQKEYRERVGRRGKIVLTNALHSALRLMSVQVPPEVVKAEQDLILDLPALSSLTARFESRGTASFPTVAR
jgi:hypothetical protein